MELFVGGLTPWATETLLEELFSKYGRVESVNIVRDLSTGLSRRFGFVEMPKERQAKRAIRALDGADYQGLYISVIPKRRHASA